MKRVTLCLAAAGFMLWPALAWADRPCCGESVEAQSTTDTGQVQTTGETTTVSSPCRPGQPCSAGGGETRSESACATCSPCAACPTAGTACESPCVTEQAPCCPQRTTYRLVRDCQPVARVRTVCQRDPCNPCKVRRTSYTEWTNQTRYRWVAETTPVCTTGVTVYNLTGPACCGEVSYQSSTGWTSSGSTLATATTRR